MTSSSRWVLVDLVLLPAAATVRRADRLVIGWIVVWVVLAGVASVEVWRLDRLGRSAVDSGTALQDTGRVIEQLSRLPLVGDGVGRLGARVSGTGSDVRAAGTQGVASAHRLAVIVGVGTAALGGGPVMLGYLPFRVARRRRVAGLRRLAVDAPAPALVEHLAAEALARQPLSTLTGEGGNPYGALRAGHRAPLARLELSRLGIEAPAAWGDEWERQRPG